MTHNGQAAFRKFIKVVQVLTFLLVEIRWRLLSLGHHDDQSPVNSVYYKPDIRSREQRKTVCDLICVLTLTCQSVNEKSLFNGGQSSLS